MTCHSSMYDSRVADFCSQRGALRIGYRIKKTGRTYPEQERINRSFWGFISATESLYPWLTIHFHNSGLHSWEQEEVCILPSHIMFYPFLEHVALVSLHSRKRLLSSASEVKARIAACKPSSSGNIRMSLFCPCPAFNSSYSFLYRTY